ncbi:hypothetical protein [Rossellomorea marisflavi]|uniref:hypothetical protein n=1 Tax=Rossellomorea marisflavi TaxID=189381 RepID=UPI00138F2538|nr:hypothetical protein [Rossellomorea marisflavi]
MESRRNLSGGFSIFPGSLVDFNQAVRNMNKRKRYQNVTTFRLYAKLGGQFRSICYTIFRKQTYEYNINIEGSRIYDGESGNQWIWSNWENGISEGDYGG